MLQRLASLVSCSPVELEASFPSSRKTSRQFSLDDRLKAIGAILKRFDLRERRGRVTMVKERQRETGKEIGMKTGSRGPWSGRYRSAAQVTEKSGET